MSEIELEDSIKKEAVQKLQTYFVDELQHEIGSFEADFLLDFIAKNIGNYYYNQGLADALKTFEMKLVDISDEIYQLEKATSKKAAA